LIFKIKIQTNIFKNCRGGGLMSNNLERKKVVVGEIKNKFEKAKSLYLFGDLNVTNERVSFKFTKGDTSNVHALKLSFYHRTIKANDFEATLTPNANKEFTALLDNYTEGAYSIFIVPIDGSWKLKENIILPTTHTVSVTPDYK
jgi:hypothetical protein